MFKTIALIITSVSLAASATVQAQNEDKTTAPTDAEIAQIVLTADTIDINYGKLAEKKSNNEEVKEFAKTMIRDHSSVNKKATELAKKLKLKPQSSEISRNLESNSQATLAKLEKLSGSEFDQAYVDNEVAYHEAVIKVLDETLIPNAENTELKELLESGRPIFVSHLEHAKQIQSSLK